MPDAVLTALPDWAEHEGENRHGMPVIGIDDGAMYPEILAEYAAHYEENVPDEFLTQPEDEDEEPELRPEWADALAELDPAEPSAYWLEVAYQTAKLDLWVATRSTKLEIHVHSEVVEDDEGEPRKRWAQRNAPEGRSVDRASGGLQGANEARAHYKRLRGFFPG